MQSKIKSILNRLNRRDLPLFPKFRIYKYFKIGLIVFVLFSAVFISKTILAQDATSETDSGETTSETAQTETTEVNPVPVPQESIQVFQEKQSAMEEGNNQESWMKESIGSNAMVGINVLAGTIPNSLLEGKATTWVPGGVLGFTTKSIASLYNIPISGVEYLAYVKDNFFGKPTYAATGSEGMSYLIPLWKGFRNVTYILFSVVFVVIGIMIMLRIKISPQAVINIQSALPKLITALILVTFSYAIVGLLIDLSYVIAGLGISIVSKASGFNYDVMKTIDKPMVAAKLFGLAPFGAATIIASLVAGICLLIPGIGFIVTGVAFILVFLGLIIFVFIQVFKFFIALIKCYVSIILKTIIAPLEIALGAIPNVKMGFGSWFVDILANVMVFPITLVFLVMAEILMTTIRKSTNLWTPPGLDFLSGGDILSGDILSVVIGLGSLMLVAKLPKLIPEFIFQIKPSPYGKAMGETFTSTVQSVQKSDMYRQAGEKIGKNMNSTQNSTGGPIQKATAWVGARMQKKFEK